MTASARRRSNRNARIIADWLTGGMNGTALTADGPVSVVTASAFAKNYLRWRQDDLREMGNDVNWPLVAEIVNVRVLGHVIREKFIPRSRTEVPPEYRPPHPDGGRTVNYQQLRAERIFGEIN